MVTVSRQPSKDEWLEYAVREAEKAGGVPRYALGPNMDEVMELADQQTIETDPVHWLQYYASHMAFYATEVYIFRAAIDLLEERYKRFINTAISGGDGSIAKREARAKYLYGDLREAIASLKARLYRASTEHDTASSYRDTVSRIVTLVERERKVTRQW